MNYRQTLLIAISGTLLAGCASLPETYVPSTVGPVQHQATQGQALECRIHSVHDAVVAGEPVEFVVLLRNRSDQAIWVPSRPDVVFLWTYSNGRRDNFMRDDPMPQFFTSHNAVLLQPGEQLTRTVRVDTRNFLRNGVTEFRALVQAPTNLNPELNSFWTGRTVSNGYGVLVADRATVASHRATHHASLQQARP